MHSNMASGMNHQTAFQPQAATMQPAFAAPILMQPGYMAPVHLPTPSMGLPYMQQAAHMHNMQQQAAAMHMYQQQQLFMMQQQHAPMHDMGEQPYRVDPLGQLPRVPSGCRRLWSSRRSCGSKKRSKTEGSGDIEQQLHLVFACSPWCQTNFVAQQIPAYSHDTLGDSVYDVEVLGIFLCVQESHVSV